MSSVKVFLRMRPSVGDDAAVSIRALAHIHVGTPCLAVWEPFSVSPAAGIRTQ